MSKSNTGSGGYIGAGSVPSALSASGIWSMTDVLLARKSDTWPSIGNFFGSGIDGAVTISSNTNLTVQNKNGLYDGDMVVRQYQSLTINSGVTLTTDQPCRGLLIYVSGNCVINGTLSMTARGALANPTVDGGSDLSPVNANGLRFPFRTASGSATLASSASLLDGCGTSAKSLIASHPTLAGNGTVITIPRSGGAGGAAANSGANAPGNVGSTGATGATGGGGSGGTRNGNSGPGSAGTCFSGGSGGGGNHYAGVDGFNTLVQNAGQQFGGRGGYGYNGVGANEGAGGGAGNPGGLGAYNPGGFANSTEAAGASGTGGLLVLIVGGSLTIGATGVVSADGSNGGTGQGSWAAYSGGGGSGGGSVVLAHRGSYQNSGSVRANGGPGGGDKAWVPSTGGAGAAGSVQVLQVS